MPKSRRAGGVLLAGALLALPATAAAVDTVGVTERVSVSSDEVAGDGFVDENTSLSDDGRFVAFHSDSANLVPEDTNNGFDVFVRDRLAGTTERVSVSSSGKQAGADTASLRPSISDDGRYVAFESTASNLAGGDKDNTSDIFVHDRVTGETTLVSAGDGTFFDATRAAISGDGDHVAYLAETEIPDAGFRLHTFVYDRQTGVTQRVSEAPDGTPADGGSAFAPHLSFDGQFVFFSSFASNLTPDVPDEGGIDAFLYDRATDSMTAITSPFPPAFVGSIPHGVAEGISADGRYLTFTGGDGFIEPDDNDFSTDAWLVDTSTDPFTYTLVSRNDAGEQADEISHAGPVSDNGRYVAFESRGTNLGGPSRFGFHIYLRDLSDETTRLVSIPPGGGEFDVESLDPSMSADGLVVGFHNFRGAFVRDMRPAADLAVAMVDDPDPVVERGQVTYTVTVDNLGPGNATNTTLVDTLPADPTFVSATTDDGTCVRDANSNSGGVLTCDLGTLATGQQATVTIVLEPRREGTIGNTATVDAAQADPDTANNSAGQTTAVMPR